MKVDIPLHKERPFIFHTRKAKPVWHLTHVVSAHVAGSGHGTGRGGDEVGARSGETAGGGRGGEAGSRQRVTQRARAAARAQGAAKQRKFLLPSREARRRVGSDTQGTARLNGVAPSRTGSTVRRATRWAAKPPRAEPLHAASWALGCTGGSKGASGAAPSRENPRSPPTGQLGVACAGGDRVSCIRLAAQRGQIFPVSSAKRAVMMLQLTLLR